MQHYQNSTGSWNIKASGTVVSSGNAISLSLRSCVACGARHDRDHNASINIFNAVFGGSIEPKADVEPVIAGGCNVAA